MPFSFSLASLWIRSLIGDIFEAEDHLAETSLRTRETRQMLGECRQRSDEIVLSYRQALLRGFAGVGDYLEKMVTAAQKQSYNGATFY